MDGHTLIVVLGCSCIPYRQRPHKDLGPFLACRVWTSLPRLLFLKPLPNPKMPAGVGAAHKLPGPPRLSAGKKSRSHASSKHVSYLAPGSKWEQDVLLGGARHTPACRSDPLPEIREQMAGTLPQLIRGGRRSPAVCPELQGPSGAADLDPGRALHKAIGHSCELALAAPGVRIPSILGHRSILAQAGAREGLTPGTAPLGPGPPS